MNDAPSPTAGLADHLASHREELLQAWRQAGLADPGQPTAQALDRAQFLDHIPDVLDALERRLRHRPAGHDGADNARADEVKHGLQRWQQGYRLEELMREWAHLHACIDREVERYARSHVAWSLDAHWAAQRIIVGLIHEGVTASAAQYSRMDRADAAGRLRDLEKAVAQLRRIDEGRRTLLREAVHDLRGNVQSASHVAELLRTAGINEEERIEFAGLLEQNISTVATMLQDMLELTRLEAGQERRAVSPFDAAHLVRETCRLNHAAAATRGLYLRTEGQPTLPVVGDAPKVRRLLQNLLLNALKYTDEGGVSVAWDADERNWWIRIQDTGPGLMGGPGTPLAMGLSEATSTARDAEEKNTPADGRPPQVLDQSEVGAPLPAPRSRQLSGEGIGLAIVKRLCDLLEARLEVVSSADSGTIFRIVLPRSYPGTGSATSD